VKTSIHDMPNGGAELLTPNQKVFKEALEGGISGAEVIPRGSHAKDVFDRLEGSNVLTNTNVNKKLNIETKKLDIDYEL
ncbi:hypothetical protein, partial [Saccharicrinis aurantiacus]|uniref:hypothetical protein n=1 Tax=Saccharicrinis aurantiacus TaxID=1849719 RepID=UPI0015C580AA